MSLKKTLLFLIAVLLFSTCKKVDPPVQKTQTTEPTITLSGEWVLRSGMMYFTNSENGQKIKYSHFGGGRTTSSLRYDAILYNIEKLIQDTTTWSFYPSKVAGSYGVFVLNNDSLHSYGLNITTDFWSIIENPTATSATMQMGGSARPFSASITDYTNKIGVFHIQNGTCSIGGYNYEYFSELTMQKIKEW